jgi:hypothetical protein
MPLKIKPGIDEMRVGAEALARKNWLGIPIVKNPLGREKESAVDYSRASREFGYPPGHELSVTFERERLHQGCQVLLVNIPKTSVVDIRAAHNGVLLYSRFRNSNLRPLRLPCKDR